jgi:hypothetical protein
MTLEELENTFPNGLHDAEVQRVVVDYAHQKVTFDVAVFVGNVDDPPEKREAYKSGRLDITGLIFLVMEPPDPRYPYRISSKLTIDATDSRKALDADLLASLPSDAFFRTFWVSQWNACMHFAGKHAEITWLNDGAVTYRTRQELRAKG